MEISTREGRYIIRFSEQESFRDKRLASLRNGARVLPDGLLEAVFTAAEAGENLAWATLSGVPYRHNNSPIFSDKVLFQLDGE